LETPTPTTPKETPTLTTPLATPTTPELTPTPTPKPFIPGFEAIIAIAGLIALAYLMRRKS
ncbi:MAG: PGF-CTERM sorting domain-containing protein, partial [Archaeoglobaceae archaeon]|nr:PGF-CTERM sorting domain-containing protein [Archaeoglobaceae archaeon]MDW8118821.1 PGF-CTERM sorting domain-containing protein [Archaeoglobaceae archaeon]